MNRLQSVIGIFLLLFLAPSHVLAQGDSPSIPPVPTGGNVVLDTLDWLTPSQEAEINTINQKLDEDGIAQIAIVTLDDCGEDKQKFRNELFRTWGIGHADDNDGLLIMICWYGGDPSHRSVEQETGYGLEGTLPDVLTGRIVDEEFIPAFQSDRPGDGLVAMVKRYDEILRRDIPSTTTTPLDKNLAFLIIGFFGIVPGGVLAVVYSSVSRTNEEHNTRGAAGAVIEDEQRSGVVSYLYVFALAEFISLIPILGMIFAGLRRIFKLPPSVQAYAVFVFPFLAIWCIVLILFYVSRFFRNVRRDIWDTQENTDRSSREGQISVTDILNTVTKISRDISSFDDGDSGGGGSSKKF